MSRFNGTKEEIINRLPYSSPFLFVDKLYEISDEGVEGSYRFDADAFYYKGHFKDKPVTPGVILTECMAQIGVVCLGVFLMRDKLEEELHIAMTSTNIDFYLPILPGEEVKVSSERVFFRFSKLKCKVRMYNSAGKLVCKGEISGMVKE